MAMLGTAIMGIGGLLGMKKGYDKIGGLASNQPSAEHHRQNFEKTQGLIDTMTNFNQYSGPAMDLATQEGNQGVENALMLGMGGSQANAIKNRLKKSGINQAYQNFTSGLGEAAKLQSGIDQNIFGQMVNQQNFSNQIKMGQANAMMGLGNQLLPEGGIRSLGGIMGTGLKTLGKGFFPR